MRLHLKEKKMKKISIVSGFLGAGKTTFIYKILKNMQEPVILIENDYGDQAVDVYAFEDIKVEIKEIAAGCICCNLEKEFKNVLNEIKKSDINHILIEPSGMANIKDLISILNEKDIKKFFKIEHIFNIVDALMFDFYYENFPSFFEEQIKSSNLVLINKIQSLSISEICNLRIKLSQINQGAKIMSCFFEDINYEDLLGIKSSCYETRNRIKILNSNYNIMIKNLDFKRSIKYKSKPKKEFLLDVLNVEIINEKPKKEWDLLFSEISKKFEMIFRIKGLVNIEKESIRLDWTPRELNFYKLNKNHKNKIWIVGQNLEKQKIKDLLKLKGFI